jgi:glutamate formiminotransferase / 5-formyltetrahydrofolate cyclo-ligase
VSLECVVNVSEGRDVPLLDVFAAACGDVLLDVHRDPDHHRSVFTLGGAAAAVEAAARDLTAIAVARLDLADHDGRHPRVGVVDVVPFVPLPPRPAAGADDANPADAGLGDAIAARDRFAQWAGATLSLPCFLYGPLPDDGDDGDDEKDGDGEKDGGGEGGTGRERSLPAVRRDAFGTLPPDTGPPRPHPTAGGCAVGARSVLVAYNLWLAGGDGTLARSVASAIRGPAVRALGLELGGAFQVSCNLVRPFDVGPAEVYDRVVELLEGTGASVTRSEVVGLVPAAVVDRVPTDRWPELDLRPDATIEARLTDRSLRPG